MSKRVIIFIFIFFLFFGKRSMFPEELVDIGFFNLPFSAGEKLNYRMYLKGVSVGSGELVFHGNVIYNDINVYYATFKTKIFNIRDIEEIYFEKSKFLPLRIKRDIVKIGLPDEKINELYDQERFRVEIVKKVFPARKTTITIEKDSFIHNVILLSYYFRVLPQKYFQRSFHISVPTADLDISFKGIEKVKVPLGTFDAYVFEGQPKNFRFYISTEEDKIPLRIENPAYYMALESIEKIEEAERKNSRVKKEVNLIQGGI